MRPTRNTPVRPSLAGVDILRDQTVGRGSVRMMTSLMILKAPIAINEATWSPHTPSAVRLYVLTKGRQIKKTWRMLPTLQSETKIRAALVAMRRPRLTKTRR
jgi:hypothetical protein